MAVPAYVRWVLSLLTGLWVTIGAAVPIGYFLLNLIKANNEGRLGPELLERPSVVLLLSSGYALAAAIGGWAAGWVTINSKWRLAVLLSLVHLGTWLIVIAAGAVSLPAWFALTLSGAAVAGSVVGVGARALQVERRSRNAPTS